MWCWCSNVVISSHATPCFKAALVPSISATPCFKALVPSISATSLPHRQEPITEQRVGVLGHTLTAKLTNLESNSNQEKQEISGSDVLWALQKATTSRKIINNNKKKERGRDSSSLEESSVDFHVRPLCINEHWAHKLDELEIRLRHLSDTT